MAKGSCKLCKQDISEVTLIRCRDAECPLLTKSAASGGVSTVGILALGSVALCAVIFGWRAGAPAPATPSPTPSATESASAMAVTTGGIPAEAKKTGWMARAAALFVPPKHDEQQGDPTPDVLPSGPDPQAAARVQTFSCATSKSPARALICTDWTLATVDYNLSLAYNQALTHSSKPKALRRAQAAWQAKVDKLGPDSKAVLDAYQQRYAELDVTPAT